MASALEVKEMEKDYERLQGAVLDYIAALDNPASDEDETRKLLTRLRDMTGAPAEPAPETSQAFGI